MSARVRPAASGSGAAIVQVQGLHHSFPDGWDALNGIDLTLERGEFAALIGPNGSGKTTLAKHLNGLLKPTAGRVLVAGRDTRETGAALLARHVGYVFQNPDHQIFSATVREELAFAPNAQGVPGEEARARVERELDALGLRSVAERPPAILSPGQRRRVAIAGVLTAEPDVLVLDEPNAGLDAREQEEVLTRVAAYNTAGHAVVLITHDMRLVARWTRRCLLLARGVVLADGSPSRVLGNAAALADAGMRLPPLVRLAQALAPHGMPSGHLEAEGFARAYLALLEQRP